MHPIALFHKIFPEEQTLESSSNEIEHLYTHRKTYDSKRDLLQFSPHYFKSIPCLGHFYDWGCVGRYEHGFLPLIIHSTPPPPPPP